ncbi:hypothetical protein QFC21_000759 [Naganishia friedmannii]|uniref:Uncharacterized protein n=1 Tax=Naganishia friedmannii TaxID=89922 RepID=A0ACC2W7X1_9TREE|nr:hypothetical protein QFC21_000759 [Naganishia friedmannii]
MGIRRVFKVEKDGCGSANHTSKSIRLIQETVRTADGHVKKGGPELVNDDSRADVLLRSLFAINHLQSANMITGIGTDILHLARLRNVIARRGADRLARRILSASEMTEFSALHGKQQDDKEGLHAMQTRFLASRWAAKEALYKAAYPTFQLTWKQIELYRDETGVKPMLRYIKQQPGVKKEEARDWDLNARNLPTLDDVHDRIHVSLSHDGDLLVAYVVLESVP